MKKHAFANWRFRNFPKWGSISYVVRTRRATIREGLELWAQARRDFVPGSNGIFGERTIVGDFFTLIAEKQYAESEERMCINGNCTEFWYRGRNTGGFGPAGCGCS